MTMKKLALVVAAGALTTALVGGAAFAAFQPFANDQQVVVPGTAATADRGPIDHLKQILDPLVQKGTISQAQEDAILQAWKDATPSAKPRPLGPKPGHPGAMRVRGFIGNFLKTSSDYLGVPVNDLVSQLKAGKSLADVATATPGKSRQGLVDALTKAASDRIDQAVQSKKVTADQATTLKADLSTEIGRLVDRKGGTPGSPGFGPHKPTPSPSPKS